jgi:hyperosmotically inducible protein
MNVTRSLHIIAFSIFMCFASMPALAQDTNQNTKNVQPDNTGVNTRDRNTSERTADQAKNNLSDREMMQKIRQSIMADKSLSTYAKNIKIISEQGQVTLKGPVRSEAERKNINDKAKKVAGQDNIHDELTVKAVKRKSGTKADTY